MSEGTTRTRMQRRGPRGISGPIILIGLGVAFLLNNLGIIDVNWLNLWRYWPVFLILIGIDVLFSGRSSLVSLALIVLSLAVVGGVIFMAGTSGLIDQTPFNSSDNIVTHDISYAMQDVETLTVDLALGATEANVYALSAGNSQEFAVDGTLTTDKALDVEVVYDTQGRTGYLNVKQQENESFAVPGDALIGELDLGLTNAVPLDLIVNSGAGAITLDLSDLNLQTLEVHSGAGSLTLLLPETGDYTVTIDAGIGAIDIEVPSSLEARLDYDGISIVDVNPQFDKLEDGIWETDGYSTALDRATININTGPGAITIR